MKVTGSGRSIFSFRRFFLREDDSDGEGACDVDSLVAESAGNWILDDEAAVMVVVGAIGFHRLSVSCISVPWRVVDAGAVGGCGGGGEVCAGWVETVLFVLPTRSRGAYPLLVKFVLSLATVVPLLDLLPSPPGPLPPAPL